MLGNMLIVLLLVAVSECGAQEIGANAQPRTDESLPVTYDAQWNSEGQYSLINTQTYSSEASKSPQTDNLDFTVPYSSFWRPYSTPPVYVSHESGRTREEGVDGLDYDGQNPPTLQPAIPDSNDSFPFIYALNPFGGVRESVQSSQAPASQQPTELSRTPVVENVPQTYPIFYSPSLNTNTRHSSDPTEPSDSQRAFSNNSEPPRPSYEGASNRAIPQMTNPGVPLTPDHLLPYGGYGYPMHFYPFPAFMPPQPAGLRGLSTVEDDTYESERYFDRVSGVGSGPVADEQKIRAPPEQRTPAPFAGPRGIPNPFVFPPPPRAFRIPPQAFQRFMIPAPIVDRDPNRQPSPAFRDLPSPPEETNEVIPPFPPTFQRYPFAWRPPMIPGGMPNSIPRFIPSFPPFVPGIRNTPEAVVPVAKPPVVEDRLPLDTNVEAVLPEAPVPPEVVAEELKVEAVIDEINRSERRDTPAVPYEFGFDMNDGKGTDQHRMEVSNGAGEVRGSYGYRDLFGVYRLVNYVADKDGFRAFVKSNEPGVASAGSADVLVQAEHPPPHAIEESLRATEPKLPVIPNVDPELIADRID